MSIKILGLAETLNDTSQTYGGPIFLQIIIIIIK